MPEHPSSEPSAGASWRRGVRLAIDWGRARVGVAACDPDGLLAYPVETVPNDQHTIARLGQLIAEYEPIEVLLGMPIDLAGRLTMRADTGAPQFARDSMISRTSAAVSLVRFPALS